MSRSGVLVGLECGRLARPAVPPGPAARKRAAQLRAVTVETTKIFVGGQPSWTILFAEPQPGARVKAALAWDTRGSWRWNWFLRQPPLRGLRRSSTFRPFHRTISRKTRSGHLGQSLIFRWPVSLLDADIVDPWRLRPWPQIGVQREHGLCLVGCEWDDDAFPFA
jgi:hypothetical protein